jgi:hypothetical protein
MHNNLLDPLQNLNTDPLARIYWVAADALAQVAEMDYEYQFNDVGKWDAHNEYLAPAQLTKAKIFRNMQ